LIPTRKQWKSWSLPSKLAAIGTLVGILGFGGYIIEKGYGISQAFNFSRPKVESVFVVVEFENEKDQKVTISTRGDAFLWHPGTEGNHEIYTFEIIHYDSKVIDDGAIIVPPHTKKRAIAKLLPISITRRYLEQGHMDLSLYFRGIGFTKFSPNVPFTTESIEHYYISMKF
jgi:hypothetical protein